jgi:hypothetical protein
MNLSFRNSVRYCISRHTERATHSSYNPFFFITLSLPVFYEPYYKRFPTKLVYIEYLSIQGSSPARCNFSYFISQIKIASTIVPVDTIKLYREVEVYIPSFSTSVLAKGSGMLHAAVVLLPGKSLGTQWVWSLGDSRVQANHLCLPRIETWILEPPARTDYTVSGFTFQETTVSTSWSSVFWKANCTIDFASYIRCILSLKTAH